jgi:nitrate reductase gamma subunit
LLWKRGIGIGWPALPQQLADYLTLLGIVGAVVLVTERVFGSGSRALSRPQDYALPVLVLATFISGYLAANPRSNPFTYDSTILVHALGGDLVLVFLPFSKLSHALLFPLTQLAGEIGWYLVPGSGERVAATLKKENEPI